MTQEEKAKRYDEALHKAKNYYSTTDSSSDIKLIGLIFPELKESEDERIRKWLIHYFKEVCDNVSEKEKKGIVAWLEKQPKDSPVHSNSTNIGKVEQKQEWSEEDEKILSDIIKDLVHPWNEYIPDRIENEIKWLKNKLKSLRPQNTWKPSDEQMRAIEHICDGNYNVDLDILDSIYRDFKKLRK